MGVSRTIRGRQGIYLKLYNHKTSERIVQISSRSDTARAAVNITEVLEAAMMSRDV